MSKVRITEPGWEKYTGMLGTVEFIDGESVESLSRMEAGRLAGIVRMENVDSATNPSIAQQIIDSQAHLAEVQGDVVVPKSDEPQLKFPQKYTKEELEIVADKGGIKGLRAIGDPMGVRANSITDLITKILEAQAAPAPAPEGETKPAGEQTEPKAADQPAAQG